MANQSSKKNSFFSPLAALAAAVSPFRPGTTSPGAAPPLAGSPVGSAAEAHSSPRGRIRRSLRACTAEGLAAEVVNSCAGGAVLTGWAIHLNASPLVTGVVVALPQMAQLFQIPAAWSTALFGHRRACLTMVAASRQVLLPLLVLPFVPLSDSLRQSVLLGFAALAAVLGVLGNNAWVAWMGELVPRRIRGRYFGRRTALCMLAGALASAGAGLLLDWAKPRGFAGHGLATLQLLACLSGVLTTILMSRQHDPCPGASGSFPLRLDQALVPFRDRSVRGLLVYQLAWGGAVGLAGSFFSLHMLKNLNMGFTLVALHGAALAAMRMLAAPLWGKLLDRVGARPVLITCSFGISFIPLGWLFSSETFLWPLLIDVILAGVLWCGHGLAIFSLPLAIAPRAGRPFYLAAFSGVGGLAFSFGTGVGGLLVQSLPDKLFFFGHQFYDIQMLFLFSGTLRLSAAFFTLRISEPSARGVAELWTAIGSVLSGRPARPPVGLGR